MIINRLQFVGSFNRLEELPDLGIPEIGFIGRSNVGKSSLINYLTQKKGLAKVSSTPGKTQSLNYFLVNDSWYLVDMPGYGYAKRSRSLRQDWEKTMYRYFEQRRTLHLILLLIDSRIKPMKSDLEMIEWLGDHKVPFAIVFTKADERELKSCKQNIQSLETILYETWEELPEEFITSSAEKRGAESLLSYIDLCINLS